MTTCVPVNDPAPVVPAVDNTPITFVNSKWIWTSEKTSGSASFKITEWIWPSESEPSKALHSFRKVFMAPAGKTAISAYILSVSHDNQTFFVNGRAVINGPGAVPQSVCVGLEPELNVFAVEVENSGNGPAGLLGAMRVTYFDGTTTTLLTDASWRADAQANPGFETISFDDNSWSTAYVFADYNQGPSRITEAATLEPQSVTCEGLGGPQSPDFVTPDIQPVVEDFNQFDIREPTREIPGFNTVKIPGAFIPAQGPNYPFERYGSTFDTMEGVEAPQIPDPFLPGVNPALQRPEYLADSGSTWFNVREPARETPGFEGVSTPNIPDAFTPAQGPNYPFDRYGSTLGTMEGVEA
ncbi:hypothetical protein FB451DRAFT_1134063, partial [Mycena latifolia]